MSSTRSSTESRKEAREATTCKYRTETDANLVSLVFECKACKGGGSLESRICMREALSALRSEFNADSIIFSDYIETKYFGPVVETLRRMAKVLNEIERFALRRPWESRLLSKGSEVSEQRKTCAKCRMNPSLLFGAMRKGGEESPEQLLRTFNGCIAHLNAFNPFGICVQCVETTKGDMRYIHSLLQELRTYVLYQAFKIVEGSS